MSGLQKVRSLRPEYMLRIRRILFAPFRGFAETDRNRALTALFIQLDVCWPSAPGHLASACQPCKNSESQSKRLALLYRSLSTSIVGFFNNLIFCVGCEILCSDNIVCMVRVQKLASDSNWLGKCRSVGQILAQSNHWHLLNHDSSATQGSITLLVSLFKSQQGPSNIQKWQ